MRFSGRLSIVLLALLWLFIRLPVVQAAPPGPSIPQTPPQIPEHLTTLQETGLPQGNSMASGEHTLQSASLSALPPLKAVLLVGPIDGDYGTWTEDEKANMELAASELQSFGVTVHKFYTPHNDWAEIKQAAQGAHFLLYRGHGVYWGDPNLPSNVGGFALKDRIITPDTIQAELNLATNAIIMLYGCYTAGSSSSDTHSLSSPEAQRRSALYAQPFLNNGAGGYFANWFGNAFQMYIRYLFQGKTLGQAYESFFDFNASTVERYLHPVHSHLSMWLDKDEWYDPKPQYNNAFIGKPSATLADLFAPTPIEVVPEAISYLAEPFSGPRTIEVQLNTSSSDVTWTTSITPGASWIEAPTRGSASDPIRVTVTPPTAVGTYQATISIQAGSSTSQSIELAVPVTLHVTDDLLQIYLPGLTRGR
jgi:hypothetical protein